MIKPYNVDNYETSLQALMGAQSIIKYLMTKEEIEEVTEQVESTWKFKHWPAAKSLLDGIVDSRLRLLENNKKFEEMLVDNLKAIRKETGRSQTDTAASAKMSSRTIYKVENGAVSPQVSYLVRMYSAMGIDIMKDVLSVQPKNKTNQ